MTRSNSTKELGQPWDIDVEGPDRPRFAHPSCAHRRQLAAEVGAVGGKIRTGEGSGEMGEKWAAKGGFAWEAPEDEQEMDLPFRVVLREAAELLTSDRLAQVRECAGDTCTWLFLDGTRNHSRTWCDMGGCGNRAKVRRHRARQA